VGSVGSVGSVGGQGSFNREQVTFEANQELNDFCQLSIVNC
jgi:hypothetical protein